MKISESCGSNGHSQIVMPAEAGIQFLFAAAASRRMAACAGMTKILFCFCIIVSLNGCDPRTGPIEPFEVKVPVAVSCAPEALPAPDWNVPQLLPSASATDKLKAALADLELSHGYAEELEAELAACG